MEYGYVLFAERCALPFGDTNQLPIHFPENASGVPPDGYPELGKLHSDTFLRASFEGKKGIYCRCVGEISYPNGIATFVLHRAEVYLD